MHGAWSDGMFDAVKKPKSASSSRSGGPLSLEDRGKNCALNAEQWSEGLKFLLLVICYNLHFCHINHI
jgi:hypothetical protein